MGTLKSRLELAVNIANKQQNLTKQAFRWSQLGFDAQEWDFHNCGSNLRTCLCPKPVGLCWLLFILFAWRWLWWWFILLLVSAKEWHACWFSSWEPLSKSFSILRKNLSRENSPPFYFFCVLVNFVSLVSSTGIGWLELLWGSSYSLTCSWICGFGSMCSRVS